MLMKKYLKQIAFFGLLFAVIAVNSTTIKAKKVVETSYTYYTNKKVKTKFNVIKDGNKLLKKELYTYNKKGNLVSLYAIKYGKKNLPLVRAKYKYINKNKQKQIIKYYYDTHSKKHPQTKKAYLTVYYDKKGKIKDKVYHTDNGKRNEIALLAKELVGKNYRGGGQSPKTGFDCSGLTSYVYKTAADMKIGRSSYDQNRKGKYVKLNVKNLKKGDILFWGSKSAPYHVGIYVGNGKYVHASTPRTGVEIKPLSHFTPSYAKRMIN